MSEGVIRKEFNINEFITLKLVGYPGGIHIFVNGKFFNQCKFLLLNIDKEKISELDEINSIDEAAETLNRSLEGGGNDEMGMNIPAETEFWGHCSNLQAWAENEYDTRLLHRNLSFPLLKKLTEAGDPIAKRVFNEEIVQRFEDGYEPVMIYLSEEGYLNFLSDDEIETLAHIILQNNNIDIKSDEIVQRFKFWIIYLATHKDKESVVNQIYEMNHLIEEKNYSEIKKKFESFDAEFLTSIVWKDFTPLLEELKLQINCVAVSNEIIFIGKDKNLSLISRGIYNISEIMYLQNNKDLKSLNLKSNYIDDLTGVESLIDLEELNLSDNPINDLSTLKGLKKLKKLSISNIQLLGNIDVLRELPNLEELDLSSNRIKNIPEVLEQLKGLKTLTLSFNSLINIEILKNLLNLEELDLSYNQIQDISMLGGLIKLRSLNLNENKLQNVQSLRNLTTLNKLSIGNNNKITSLKELEELVNLEHLDVRNDRIATIRPLKNLTNLKYLDLFGNRKIKNLSTLRSLIKLQELLLGNNPISDIYYISNLKNLEKLNLSGTKVDAIPETFTQLKNLKEICALNCNLEYVPLSMMDIFLTYKRGDTVEFEKETGKNVYWGDRLTKNFKEWMKKKLRERTFQRLRS